MKKLQLEALGRLNLDAYAQIKKLPIILVLDNIRSLHNVGAIFRTCDAFAIEAIYLCGLTGTPPNREIYKTALGAELSVHWEYFPTTLEAIHKLIQHQFFIIALEQTTDSKSLLEMVFSSDQSYAFILGNEVDGVDETLLPICNMALEIPQFGTKHSFNVSVSAGIVLWEIAKQYFHSK